MDMFSDIKSVMQDLQQRKAALGEHIKEFQALQEEINLLVERSDRDPEALAKLIKLKNAFPGGFELQQNTVMNKVSELEHHFKSLETQFNLLGKIESGEVDNDIDSTSKEKVIDKVKKVRSYM
ncbi:hypothetical protein ACRN98_14260 [Shewanella oncorhynchi]|uniref:Uncharacterized protein n=1 Tax=Shewanella oncorhynchi TaxID=2726434 RepID=A0ABX1KQY6_9GAMM|nr:MULTISPECIES: hypothetical protein [Shewanella]MBW3517312.1 hypothetical protein [Shewanella sp. NKUCC01_JLK]MCU8041028.1 hypothetical protein [Shewanella sp. SM69]NLQ24626.1 hypothetical protein [Shewanella oncorhynchi]